MSAGADKDKNIAKAEAMTHQALKKAAGFVLLPEVFNFRGDTRDRKTVVAVAENIPGPSLLPLMGLAKEYRAYILAGSIFEKAPGNKAYNTSVLINPQGKPVAKYRKIHLFDARIGDKIIKESACFNAGQKTVSLPVAGFKAGLSICYDLRFPELYGQYARREIDVLTAPSCFTQKTGEAHWEVLLRARAVENLAYMLAPNQVGEGFNGIRAYGNSMIIGPWGEVIARASSDDEEIIYGHISHDHISKARAILPGIIKGR